MGDSTPNEKNINGFNAINALELQNKDIPPIEWVVRDLLPIGEALLVAPSKIGKSWLALDLSICVANGQSFMGKKATKGGVVYLALEDSLRRIKERQSKLLQGVDAPDNLHFITKAKTLNEGLLRELEEWLKEHTDVKLIIIDTFQKIRGIGNNKNAYATDYEDTGRIQEFANAKNLAILLIHHTRKIKDDDDVFNMVSGTTGIMGAADTILLISRKNRNDSKAKLCITGRDVMQEELVIERGKTECKWRLIGDTEAVEMFEEREEYNNNPIVIAIKKLLENNIEGWKGTATDLQEAVMKYGGIWLDARVIGKKLRDLQRQLYDFNGIVYSAPTNSKNRVHIIKKMPVTNLINS